MCSSKRHLSNNCTKFVLKLSEMSKLYSRHHRSTFIFKGKVVLQAENGCEIKYRIKARWTALSDSEYNVVAFGRDRKQYILEFLQLLALMICNSDFRVSDLSPFGVPQIVRFLATCELRFLLDWKLNRLSGSNCYRFIDESIASRQSTWIADVPSFKWKQYAALV